MYKQWKIDPIPATLRSQVAKYRDWLLTQEKRADNIIERQRYQESAKGIFFEKGQPIRPFAPFRRERSALQTITLAQQIVLVLGLCIFGMSTLQWHFHALSILLGILIFWYAGELCFTVFACSRAAKSYPETPDKALLPYLQECPWPSYTILCPLYHEGAIVAQFIRAMVQIEYPSDRLQILLLTEEDDHQTRAEIAALGPLPAQFTLIIVPEGNPKTKPRACNYGLTLATGKYCVIYDGEDIVDPLQLKKAVLAFASHGPELACAQAQLNFYNTYQNILTRFFTIEYTLWFDLFLPAIQKMGMALPLGGTSNHFPTSVLRGLEGWDAFNVTEDADLGMRLAQHQFTTVMLDSTTYEEANADLGNWIRQRSRWIKGYLQTYLLYTRTPFSDIRKRRWKTLVSLHLLVAGGSMPFFLNPLMWVMLLIYVFFRAQVEGVYHELFPAPILYIGVLCLIFGNFYYFYSAMIACMRRKQYNLVPWCILLPLYWLLMSVAACKGAYQLFTRPHYWEKTRHGLHLKDRKATASLLAINKDMLTAKASTQTEKSVPFLASEPKLLSSLTETIKAISTLPMAAVDKSYRKAVISTFSAKTRNIYCLFIAMVASIISILSTLYFFYHHEILLYADASSHMRIARSAFDSLTPGLAQLGSVWLPIPHILMWPFVWNDYLWYTGLAGSFVSMPCYILSSILIFLIVKELLNDNLLGIIACFTFMFNPNILYLQSTPLSELVCIFTLCLAFYFMIKFFKTDTPSSLVLFSLSVFFATLTRYDGWPLPIVSVLILFCYFLLKKASLKKTLAVMFTFSTLAFYGIFLWLLWNQMIFGDPLYFSRGPYSSAKQQMDELKIGNLFSYHNIPEAIKFYTVDTYKTVGLFLGIISLLFLFLVCIRVKKTPLFLVIIAFLFPFAYYIVALYSGQAIIWIPGANPAGSSVYMYNVRYASQMIAPISILFATGLSFFKTFSMKKIIYGGALIFIMVQNGAIFAQGDISLQDGQHNISCGVQKEIDAYLYEHYIGGKILTDVTTFTFDAGTAHIDFKNVVYQGSAGFWAQALKTPETVVSWVIVNPKDKAHDSVARILDPSTRLFQSTFTLVQKQTDGYLLYKRNDTPTKNGIPLPLYYYNPKICTQEFS